jgi:hypothetical protein
MEIEKRTLKKVLLRRDVLFSYRQMSYLLPDGRAAVQEMHRYHVAISVYIFHHSSTVPRGPGPPHIRGFTITPRRTTLDRTPPDE